MLSIVTIVIALAAIALSAASIYYARRARIAHDAYLALRGTRQGGA